MRRPAVGCLIGCLVVLFGPPLLAQPAPSADGGAGEAEAAEAPDCAGGAVRDDGSVETGYGFVPSASHGIYVQELRAGELPRRRLAKVCVCWLKTRGPRDVDFEVVFYEDAGGRPAAEPYAAVAASAAGVPESVETAGAFYEVDVSGVTLPPGVSYVGARWDPSVAKFLFICTDTSEETGKASVFFTEDRSRGWTSVFRARDPIFRPHRAIMVRAVAVPEGAVESASGAERLWKVRDASSDPALSEPGPPAPGGESRRRDQ